MFQFGKEKPATAAPAAPEHEAVESAAQSIIQNVPPVSEAADQFGEQNGSDDSVSNSGGTSGGSAASFAADSSGARFDPAIHSAGSDGAGIKTAAGLWRKKRKGKVGTDSPAQKVAGNSEMAQAADAAKARMAGTVVAHMFVQTCAGFFGPEFMPRVMTADVPDGKGGYIKMAVDEMANQERVWSDWFLATGRTDVPPNLALALGIGMYVLPRFTMPETQRKVSNFKQWIAHKYLSFKFGKKKPDTQTAR